MAAPAIISQASRAEPLQLGLPYPIGVGQAGDRAQRLMQRIAVATEGRISFQPREIAFAGAEAVMMGEVDAYFAPEHQSLGLHPGFACFGGLPGDEGMPADLFQAWMHVGGGQMLWADLAANFNVKPFLAGHTGRSAGLWLTTGLGRETSDLRGQRLSVWGLGGELVSALGAETLDFPAHHLAGALADGRLTGAEWGGLAADVGLGLHRAAPHRLTPGITQHGTALTFGMRLSFWERLSAADRAVLEACFTEALQQSAAEQTALAAVAAQVVRAQPGGSVATEWHPISQAINRIAREVVLQRSEADPVTRRIHHSFSAFKAQATRFTQFADNPPSA